MSDNKEVHFEGKIALKAIIVRDNKVLLLRDPRMTEVIWEIPGGRMNIDENQHEAVSREIMEELGINIKVGQVVHMEQFIQGNEGKRAFVIVFEATMIDVSQEIVMSPEEVCEIVWVDTDNYSQYTLFPEYKRALDCYFANRVE
jgi:ADP-ribose pyrophosphatase YjhB (NUDIX family)